MRNFRKQYLLFNLQNTINKQGVTLPIIANRHQKRMLFSFALGYIFFYRSCKFFCNSKQREEYKTTDQVGLLKNRSSAHMQL